MIRLREWALSKGGIGVYASLREQYEYAQLLQYPCKQIKPKVYRKRKDVAKELYPKARSFQPFTSLSAVENIIKIGGKNSEAHN